MDGALRLHGAGAALIDVAGSIAAKSNELASTMGDFFRIGRDAINTRYIKTRTVESEIYERAQAPTK